MIKNGEKLFSASESVNAATVHHFILAMENYMGVSDSPSYFGLYIGILQQSHLKQRCNTGEMCNQGSYLARRLAKAIKTSCLRHLGARHVGLARNA